MSTVGPVCVPPAHPRHQKVVRDLLYGADATDEMVLAGAEINSVIEHATDLSAAAPYTPPISGGKSVTTSPADR